MKDLIELDKRHFIHPTSSIQQQQENGPKVIIEKGEGIYLYDSNENAYIDVMSSLWNVSIGHGREDVAAEQMKKLAFSSAFSTFSHGPPSNWLKKLLLYHLQT